VQGHGGEKILVADHTAQVPGALHASQMVPGALDVFLKAGHGLGDEAQKDPPLLGAGRGKILQPDQTPQHPPLFGQGHGLRTLDRPPGLQAKAHQPHGQGIHRVLEADGQGLADGRRQEGIPRAARVEGGLKGLLGGRIPIDIVFEVPHHDPQVPSLGP
jgi:hypothetical protein